MKTRRLLVALVAAAVSGCGTYYDPSDTYVMGLRWFDRAGYDIARQLWEPLAAAGDCDAEFRLGLLYFLGYGVEQDVPKALSYWTSAANRGQPRAQYALGDVYFHSELDTRLFCRFGCDGVPVDPVVAYKWYLLAEKAVRYGNDREYMDHILPAIRATLSGEQKAAGEKLAASWQPSPAACKPRVLL